MNATNREEMNAELLTLLRARRSMSDALPAYTMRHDPRVLKMQEMDAQIISLCNAMGIREQDAWARI